MPWGDAPTSKPCQALRGMRTEPPRLAGGHLVAPPTNFVARPGPDSCVEPWPTCGFLARELRGPQAPPGGPRTDRRAALQWAGCGASADP